MATISDFFQHAQLAQASYALFDGLDPDSVAAALRADKGGFTVSQANEFISPHAGYSVLRHTPDDPFTGFSATVFKNNETGRIVVAIRGTDGATDIFEDAALLAQGYARDQIYSLFNYVQRLITPPEQTVAQWVRKIVIGPGGGAIPVWEQTGSAQGLGVIPSGTTIDVTGHSLGGHLAMAAARLFPILVDRAYTYNAPGFRDSTTVNGFFASLGGAPDFPAEKITNLYAEPGMEIIAGLFDVPGETLPVFIEDQGVDLPGNHRILLLTDALKLQSLFALIDPAISGNAGLALLDELLSAASSVSALTRLGSARDGSLEATLDALRTLLQANHDAESSGASALRTPLADRESFYANALSLEGAIRALPLYDAQAQSLGWTVESLVGQTREALSVAAQTDIATRYALYKLNPFAIDAPVAFYDAINGDGALERYASEDRRGYLTDAYLDDRALFLTHKIASGSENTTLGGEPWVFSNGEALYLQDRHNSALYELYVGTTSDSGLNDIRQILFGGARPDNMTGGDLADRIYAAAGNDLLDAGEGDDYLEGGRGEDIYYYGLGDGHDTVLDVDGHGRLLYADASGQQRLLTGGRQLSEGGNLYQSRADASMQYRTADNGELTVLIAGVAAITITDYRAGDLGLALEDLGGSLLAFDGAGDPATWQSVIHGDQDPGELADDLDADPITEIIQGGAGDDAITGHAGEADYFQTIQLHGGPGSDIIEGEHFYASQYYFLGPDEFESQYGELLPGEGVNAFGEAGNDRFLGSLRDDTFDGGRDHDFADAYLGYDTVSGGAGNDLLNGNEGADHVAGELDNDRLGGGAGADYLEGGEANDQLYGDSTYGALSWDGINLTLAFGALASGRFAVVVDAPSSEAGDDVLVGGAGDDEIYGGAGNDLLEGGADIDLLQGEGGDDMLFGAAGNDRLFGDSSVDAADNDAQTLPGDHGTYTYYWRAREVGPDGNDYIDAGDGDDMAWGGAGDDYLFGGAGDDSLLGGLFDGSASGNDTFEGGAGTDQLYGEDGDDTYRFAQGAGFDIAIDSAGVDRLVFGDDVLPGDIAVDAAYTDASLIVDSNADAFHLDLGIGGSAERVRLYNWFDPAERIEFVEFADGTTWDAGYLLSRNRLITAAVRISDLEGTDTNYEAFLDRDLAAGFALSIADAGGDDILGFNQVYLSDSPVGPVYLFPSLEGLVREGDDLVLDLRLSSGVSTDVRGKARLIDYFGSGQIEEIAFGDSLELVAPGAVNRIPGVYLLTANNAPLYERFNLNNSYFGISSVAQTGTDGADTLSPISGLGGVRSTYYGNGGDDLLIGAGASDTLIGGSGADRMEGTRGHDAYHINPAEADVVLDDEFGYSFSSTDTLVLSAGISLSEVAFVREGDDLVIGNARVERYFERDFAEVGSDDYPYKIERLEGDGFEILDLGSHLVSLGLFGHYTGTDADDTLNGDQFDNTVEAGGGDDLINGGKGDDAISGGEGHDTLFGEGTFRGRSETDNDRIDGGAGNDYLQGDQGGDRLLGGAGNDVLYADEGYAELPEWATGWIFIDYGGDKLVGGQGNDVLYGEQDGDTYLFGRGDGVDVIQDWGYDRWNNDHTYLGDTVLELERAIGGLNHVEGAIFQSSTWRGIFREHKIEAALPVELRSGLEAIYEGVAPASAMATLTQLREWLIEDQLDIVEFGDGIAPENLAVEVLPGELQIDIGNGERLLIRDPEDGSNYGIERFRFADGRELTLAEMMALDESIDHDMEVEGTFADNALAGGNGDDFLDGRGGSDILIGRAGDDVLFGGHSDTDEFGPVGNADVLDGGLGNDYMDGEDGADTYVIRVGEGVDLIEDGGEGFDTTEIDSDIADLVEFAGQTFTNDHWPQEIRDWGAFPMPRDLARAVGALEHGVASSVALQTLMELRDWFVAQETDVVEFGAGITPENITVQWSDSDEFLVATGANDGLLSEGVERFRFTDGGELTADQMRDLGQQVFGDFGEIDGSESADVLVGSFIDDEISGDEGDDLLLGGNGDDEISGGDGSDILVGGKGLEWGDWAKGGAGSGVYLFNRADIIANTDIVDELNVDFVLDSGSDPAAGDIDTLSFGSDIRPEDFDAFVDVFVDAGESSTTLGLMLHGTQQAILIGWSYDDGEGIFESYAIERMQFLGNGNDRVFDLAGLVEARFNELAHATERVPLPLFTPEALAAFDISDQAEFAGGQYALNYAVTGDVFTAPPNSAPAVANPLDDQTAAEDNAFSFQVPGDAFSDADGGELSYSAKFSSGSQLPAWLTFDPERRAFAGTPENSDVGSIEIRISVTDTGSLSAFDDFILSVANVNDAPVLVAPVGNQRTSEDAPFSFKISPDTFADADAIHGDALIYSATLADGSALPAWLAFDSVSGTLTGTPENGNVGTIGIAITATDQADASVSIDFQLEVVNVNDAPVVANGIAEQDAFEDSSFSLAVPANTFVDVDAGDELTYSARLADGTPLPSWLSFDAAAGVFSGMPGNADVGDTTIRLWATDAAGASVFADFTLAVGNVNDTPVLTASVGDQAINEDTPFNVTVSGAFADEDTIHGDTLTYSATLVDGSSLPAWLTVDSAIGALGGVPGNSEVGKLAIAVTATDSAGATASDVFTLTVENVNDIPVPAAPLAGQTVNEYDVFRYELPPQSFTDPDAIHGDTLSYMATLADGSSLPEWLTFDPATRAFSGAPTLSERGTHEIRVEATDSAGASAGALFTLSVLAVGNGISGDTGTDILTGTRGDDVIAAGADFDLLSGNRGNDILDGGEGGDILLGGSGDDRLLGGAGDDLLYGGSGDNRIHGGAGDDLLAGGNGADTYVFRRGDGRDAVLALGNPRTGVDTLALGADPLETLFDRTWASLQVDFYGSDDRLSVTAWNAHANQIERIIARDGSVLLDNQVEQLIQAMNQFSADNGGISWEQAIAERPQDVEAVLAAYWQPAAA